MPDTVKVVVTTSIMPTMLQDFADESSAANDVVDWMWSCVADRAGMSESPLPVDVGEVVDEWGYHGWADEGWPEDLVQSFRTDMRCHRCKGCGKWHGILLRNLGTPRVRLRATAKPRGRLAS